MRRIICAICASVMLVCNVFAVEYYLPGSGITVDIPDSYYVITHDNEVGFTLGKYLADLFAKKQEQYFYISNVFVEAKSQLDFRTGGDEEIEKYTKDFFSAYKASGYEMQKALEFNVSGARFVKAYAYKDGMLHDIAYFTVVNGYEFWIWAHSELELTSNTISEFDGIVQSISLDSTLKYMQQHREMKNKISVKRLIPNIIFIVISFAVIIALIFAVKKFFKKRKELVHKRVGGARCEFCGARLSIKHVNCPKCNAPINRQRVCKKCGAPMSDTQSFCTSCNTLQ